MSDRFDKFRLALDADPSDLHALKKILNVVKDIGDVEMEMVADLRYLCEQFRILRQNDVAIPSMIGVLADGIIGEYASKRRRKRGAKYCIPLVLGGPFPY